MKNLKILKEWLKNGMTCWKINPHFYLYEELDLQKGK